MQVRNQDGVLSSKNIVFVYLVNVSSHKVIHMVTSIEASCHNRGLSFLIM